MKTRKLSEREELIKFVLDNYWGDQLVEIPGDGDIYQDSLFYLKDCGYYMGAHCVGSWEDVWENDWFSEPAREMAVCADMMNGGSIPSSVMRSIIKKIDRKETI